MTKYFKGIKTKEALRKAYINACKKYHPDNGGDAETFKQIQNEYTELIKTLRSEKGKESSDKEDSFEIDEKLMAIINKIISLEGVEIELVGVWIWLTGNTFTHKETIKEAGFRWCKKRRKWYYSPDGNEKRHRATNKTFDEIRATYGSHKVEGKHMAYIA